ncbi:MAG: UDP-N-acetylmuramate dehydrogenase [Lacrimispora saccharolytica]|nr:UDP-N-acetylmuramate dehydrogenase [Lachnospiraceae bacterium]
MTDRISRRFCEIVGENKVLEQEPMARHTTFRIGGPADYFVELGSIEQIRAAIQVCREENLPWFVLGRGSNLLVSDKGYRGVILSIYKDFQKTEIQGETVTVQAGVLLTTLSGKVLDASLTGLEFASGIPGTIGGAVVMNAGAYGGEMKDIVRKVTVLDQDGEVRTLTCGEMQFGYRTSLAKKKGYIVLGAELTLKQGEKEKIRGEMQALKAKRIEKQPLEFPSAGSTFKRPEGYFAGKLIMDAGLRGAAVGGAQVSEKHCGFVVNTGNATAADVRELMRQVQGKVQEQFGVHLEPEVRFLGEF